MIGLAAVRNNFFQNNRRLQDRRNEGSAPSVALREMGVRTLGVVVYAGSLGNAARGSVELEEAAHKTLP